MLFEYPSERLLQICRILEGEVVSVSQGNRNVAVSPEHFVFEAFGKAGNFRAVRGETEFREFAAAPLDFCRTHSEKEFLHDFAGGLVSVETVFAADGLSDEPQEPGMDVPFHFYEVQLFESLELFFSAYRT